MTKIVTSIIAILLTVTLIPFMPIRTQAAVYSGICGDSMKWLLDTKRGTLYITGEGDMYDDIYSTNTAWRAYSEHVKIVEIGEGVRTIGNAAFLGMTEIEEYNMPDSLEEIGADALSYAKCKYIYLPDNISRMVIPSHPLSADTVISAKKDSYAYNQIKNSSRFDVILTTVRYREQLPCEVSNLETVSQDDSKVKIKWDSAVEEQKYKVYVDGYLYDEYDSVQSPVIDVLFSGDHKIKVTSIVEGIRKGYPIEVESQGTEITVHIDGNDSEPINPDNISLNNPSIENDVSTWDTVYFGNYPQTSDGDGGFKTEPIKWRVLSVDGNTAYLLADKILDCKIFNMDVGNDLTWGNSFLRRWLNGSYLDASNTNSFYDSAFTSEEKDYVVSKYNYNENPYLYGTNDKVYLLGDNEQFKQKYGFLNEAADHISKASAPTDYAVNNGVKVYNEEGEGYGNASYWNRDIARIYGYNTLSGQTYFAFIAGARGMGPTGGYSFYCIEVDDDTVGVRPVINVDLSSPYLSYAGTVASDGIVNEPEESTTEVATTKNITTETTQKPTQTTTKENNTPTNVTKPGKTKIKKAKKKSAKKILIRLKSIKGAKGYQVAIYKSKKKANKNKKALFKKIVKKDRTILKSKKFKNKKILYARARAFTFDGEKKLYGQWSKVKKVKRR